VKDPNLWPLPCERSAGLTRTSAPPRVVPYQSRSTAMAARGEALLQLVSRGVVSGKSLARHLGSTTRPSGSWCPGGWRSHFVGTDDSRRRLAAHGSQCQLGSIGARPGSGWLGLVSTVAISVTMANAILGGWAKAAGSTWRVTMRGTTRQGRSGSGAPTRRALAPGCWAKTSALWSSVST
jgi:hypothetical protein